MKPREGDVVGRNQAERRAVVDQLTRLYHAWGSTGNAPCTSSTRFDDLVFSCSVVRLCLKTQWLSTRQAAFLGPFGTIGASRAFNHFVRSDSETGLSSYFFRSIQHSSLPLRVSNPQWRVIRVC